MYPSRKPNATATQAVTMWRVWDIPASSCSNVTTARSAPPIILSVLLRFTVTSIPCIGNEYIPQYHASETKTDCVSLGVYATGMADNDGDTTDEVTDEVADEATEETKPMSAEDRRKRKEKLEKELSDLDSEDVEEVSDAVSDAAEDAAEEIADKGEGAAEDVTEEAEDAAGDIAEAASKAGVTLSPEERSQLAAAIAEAVAAKLGGKKGETKRQPDKRPKPTHFTERRLFGKGKE